MFNKFFRLIGAGQVTRSSQFAASGRLAGLPYGSGSETAGREAGRVQSGRRPAGRRGGHRGGGARIALQLAVPAALGLVIGLMLAFQAGSGNSGIVQAPLGAPVSPSLSASAVAVLGTPPGVGPDDHRRLRHHRSGRPAERARAGHPLSAHRRRRENAGRVGLPDEQRGQAGGLRPGDDPGPGDGGAVGLRPARDHPGHPAGGEADDPADPGQRGRDDRLRVQRPGPVPGRGDADRAGGRPAA